MGETKNEAAELSLRRLRHELERQAPFRSLDATFGSFLGGHGQTLMGHFLPTESLDQPSERVELATPDGDRLVGFLSRPPTNPEVGLLHIFHGLSGSSDSFYIPRAARTALEIGFAVVLWNHRGCGAGRGLALEPYHSGRSDDLARAVKWGHDFKAKEHAARRADGKTAASKYLHGVLGYSLSANAACLLAARVVPAIDSNPMSQKEFEKRLPGALPDFVIAVNPPFNLKSASERLSGGPSRLYGQSFIGNLLQGLDDRARKNPENEQREIFRNLAIRARKNLTRLTTVATFDAAYTGPAGGFRDHFDYYERASSGPYLDQAVVPLVVLSAEDDPITRGVADLPSRLRTRFENPLVLVDAQQEGGHMGYVDRSTLLAPWKNQKRWLESRLGLYLRAFLSSVFVLMVSSGCSLVDAWKSGAGPSETLYKEGRLAECPREPNCVSTQAATAEQSIVPFTYSKPLEEARAALKREMANVARAVLVKEDGNYLHFECRSPVLRFADDVEFFFNEETKTLQFRSGSRFGYSDWGTNRKRMEDIRNKILGRI